jgi:hypothetical protein
MTTMFGVIHGKTVELEQEPDWPEGERVAVTIQQAVASNTGTIPSVEQWAVRLVFDSTVSPTERIVKGTQLSAEMLVAELENGRRDEQMLEDHPELMREDVAALRAYAQVPIGIRRSFGGWAEEADALEEFLEWNRQRRRLSRREVEL